MNVYFISGLGADERVFKYIELQPTHSMIHLHWIKPLRAESLSAYAKRMSAAINAKEPFSLVGLSMGGMVAVEISKLIKPEKVIIISSVPVSTDLRSTYNWFHRLGLTSMVPVSVFKNASILKKVFGGHTRENRQLLIDVIRDGDPDFIKWAIAAVASWNNETLPDNLYHIHGAKDHVFPVARSKPTHLIEKGRHFMIVERGEEISKMLDEIIG